MSPFSSERYNLCTPVTYSSLEYGNVSTSALLLWIFSCVLKIRNIDSIALLLAYQCQSLLRAPREGSTTQVMVYFHERKELEMSWLSFSNI